MILKLPTVDQMTDILDIKPIISVSLLWVWVGALALFLLLAYLVYRRVRHREKAPPKPVVVPRRYTPRELALKELDELEALKLVEKGQFRKYYFRLSEILRHFLQDEIRLPAVDATTEEIRPHLKTSKYLTEDEIRRVDRMLVDMDLVKFAKFVPSPEEIGKLRQELRGFIQTAPAKSFQAGAKEDIKRTGPPILPADLSPKEGMGRG